MFLDGRYVENSNWTADLITHDLDIKTTSSLTFWYYMNGANIGSLRVQKLTSDGTMTTLWRRDGRQAPDWLEGHVALSVGTYRVSSLTPASADIVQGMLLSCGLIMQWYYHTLP